MKYIKKINESESNLQHYYQVLFDDFSDIYDINVKTGDDYIYLVIQTDYKVSNFSNLETALKLSNNYTSLLNEISHIVDNLKIDNIKYRVQFYHDIHATIEFTIENK